MRPDDPDPRLIAALAARIFPGAAHLDIARVDEGVSTFVYRIQRGAEVFYLRVLPEEGASFAPEAFAHSVLRERGASVPEVVYFEHRNQSLQRSVMVTTEIMGQHLGHCAPDRVPAVIAAAAGDLAIINSVPVDGFGWIDRDDERVSHLAGDQPTYRAFVCEHLEADLAVLGEQALRPSEMAAVEQSISRGDRWLDVAQGRLTHGDFDVTHIYQQDGRYTGIIDFGEIRGTDSFYDLGHFLLHDGETVPVRVFPSLLDSYRAVAPLPADYEQRIYWSSLLIAIRALARDIGKQRDIGGHPGIGAIRHAIESLHA